MKNKFKIGLSILAILSISSLANANQETELNDANKSKSIIKEENKVPIIEIHIPKVPEVPKVPKVVTIGGNPPVVENESIYEKRKRLNHKINPLPIQLQQDVKVVSTDTKKELQVGDIKNNRVSAYLRGTFVDSNSVKNSLVKAGFTLLSEYVIDKKGLLTTIVFTSEEFQKQGDKPNRGFASSMRILVDKKNKQISITNPLYTSRAFMQDEFDEKISQVVLDKLRGAFSGLKDSDGMIKFHLLPKYHFMVSMPYYKDMLEVASAKDSQTLIDKIKAHKKGKKLLYMQKLSKDRFVIGIQLSKRTSKFVKKIGYENSGLLPYPILIENGVAKILDPKYYIAVMYPKLKMSQFMTIATIPDAIEKDCGRVFR